MLIATGCSKAVAPEPFDIRPTVSYFYGMESRNLGSSGGESPPWDGVLRQLPKDLYRNEAHPLKLLVLYRGLPGSGKTTAAQKRIDARFTVSADDYMVDGAGNYKFNPRMLSICHNECQRKVDNLMRNSAAQIAVHNTFSQQWEVNPYYQMARKHGYKVEIVECVGRYGSVHNVPQSTMAAMEARWEPIEVPEDLRV